MLGPKFMPVRHEQRTSTKAAKANPLCPASKYLISFSTSAFYTYLYLCFSSEVSVEGEVKLFFGSTFLTISKNVFEESEIEIID